VVENVSLITKISLGSIKKSKPLDEKIVEDEIKTEHKEKKEEVLENVMEENKIVTQSTENAQLDKNIVTDSIIPLKSDVKTESVIDKIVEKESLMAKISLSSIKKSKTPDEKMEEAEFKVEKDHKEKKEELLETLLDNESEVNIQEQEKVSDNKANNEISENNVENNTTDNKSLPVDLAEIEKKINDKVEEEVNKKIKK
jgi:hypothetical protein